MPPCRTHRATYEKFADGTTKDISDKLPFDLPQGWAWVRLGMIFEIARGGSPRPIQSYLTSEAHGLNWIKRGDASASGKYIVSTRQKIRPEGLKKTRAVVAGDLLLTNSMSFGHPYILKVDGCIHDGWLVFHPVETGINKDFFYYSLSSAFAYSQFADTASGGVVQNLNTQKVVNALFPLPPIAEQERIKNKIEELFTHVGKLNEATDGIAKVAERIDKKILNLAIRGQLVPQNQNDEPASELVKRIEAIRKSKLGGKKSRTFASDRPAYEIDPPFDIPDSWEWVRLGDVFEHNTGKALNRNNAAGDLHEYITTSNVYWDEFRLHELKQMPFTAEELDKCTVRKGDMLVCEGGDIGRAAIWYSDKEVCIQNHLHRLRAYVDVCVPYFCFVLRLYKATNRLQGKGIGLQGFSSVMLHNLIVPLPPLAEQKRIVAKIEELRAMTKSLTT